MTCANNKQAVLFGSDDYEAHFSSRKFLENFYTNPVGKGETFEFYGFLMNNISNCLDGLSGQKFMDLGCGPIIVRAIPASRRFEEITMSDVSESNLEEIRKWADKGDNAFDWSPMLKYYAEEEGQMPVEVIGERVRSKVKRLVRCDVIKDNILEQCGGPFDAIISTLLLESACPSVEDFEKTLRNIFDALSPGGHFILAITLGCSYYSFSGNTFFSLNISHVEVLQAFNKAGFRIYKDFYRRFDWEDLKTANCEGLLVILAKKPNQ